MVEGWPSRTRERQVICRGLLRNMPLNEHLRGLSEVGKHINDNGLKIRIVYSRSNQMVGYKHVEEILKATKDNPEQSSVHVIEGGHDAHTDNPDGLQ